MTRLGMLFHLSYDHQHAQPSSGRFSLSWTDFTDLYHHPDFRDFRLMPSQVCCNRLIRILVYHVLPSSLDLNDRLETRTCVLLSRHHIDIPKQWLVRLAFERLLERPSMNCRTESHAGF
jgi:hypothetical protein